MTEPIEHSHKRSCTHMPRRTHTAQWDRSERQKNMCMEKKEAKKLFSKAKREQIRKVNYNVNESIYCSLTSSIHRPTERAETTMRSFCLLSAYRSRIAINSANIYGLTRQLFGFVFSQRKVNMCNAVHVQNVFIFFVLLAVSLSLSFFTTLYLRSIKMLESRAAARRGRERESKIASI